MEHSCGHFLLKIQEKIKTVIEPFDIRSHLKSKKFKEWAPLCSSWLFTGHSIEVAVQRISWIMRAPPEPAPDLAVYDKVAWCERQTAHLRLAHAQRMAPWIRDFADFKSQVARELNVRFYGGIGVRTAECVASQLEILGLDFTEHRASTWRANLAMQAGIGHCAVSNELSTLMEAWLHKIHDACLVTNMSDVVFDMLLHKQHVHAVKILRDYTVLTARTGPVGNLARSYAEAETLLRELRTLPGTLTDASHGKRANDSDADGAEGADDAARPKKRAKHSHD